MDTISERMRYIRSRLSLSQAEIARRVGVGRAAINKVEQGLTKTLSLQTALSIEKNFGISSEWLLTGRGSIERTTVRDSQVIGLVSKIEQLPDEMRQKVEAEIDFLLSLQGEQPGP